MQLTFLDRYSVSYSIPESTKFEVAQSIKIAFPPSSSMAVSKETLVLVLVFWKRSARVFLSSSALKSDGFSLIRFALSRISKISDGLRTLRFGRCLIFELKKKTIQLVHPDAQEANAKVIKKEIFTPLKSIIFVCFDTLSSIPSISGFNT